MDLSSHECPHDTLTFLHPSVLAPNRLLTLELWTNWITFLENRGVSHCTWANRRIRSATRQSRAILVQELIAYLQNQILFIKTITSAASTSFRQETTSQTRFLQKPRNLLRTARMIPAISTIFSSYSIQLTKCIIINIYLSGKSTAIIHTTATPLISTVSITIASKRRSLMTANAIDSASTETNKKLNNDTQNAGNWLRAC